MVDYVIHTHMVPPPPTDTTTKQFIVPAEGQFSTRWNQGFNIGLAYHMPRDRFQQMLMELNTLQSAKDYKALYHQRSLHFLVGVATCYVSACWYAGKIDRLYKQYQKDVKSICSKYSTASMSVNYVFNSYGNSYIRIDVI